MTLQTGTTQRDVDRAAGSEVATCLACGHELGECDEPGLCDECEEKAGTWQCEECGGVFSLPERKPFVCPSCDSLVCQGHMVASETVEDFVCGTCAEESV